MTEFYCYRGPWTTVGVFTCSLKGSQNAKDPGTDCLTLSCTKLINFDYEDNENKIISKQTQGAL